MERIYDSMAPPLEAVTSDPRLPDKADVVVIGGGIVGVSAAYFLAKKGHSVALLEKGRIAAEQSSRNWGWCRQQNRDRRELPLMQHSMALWATLDSEINADMGFRRTGLIYVTKDPQELASWEAWVTMAQQFQVGSRMLTAAEAREMTPGNAQDWIGGVHSPHDGRAEPTMAAPALAEGARRLGASIHQQCAVRGVDIEAGRVAGVSHRSRADRDRVGALRCRRLDIDVLPAPWHRPAAGQRTLHRVRHDSGRRGDGGRVSDPGLHSHPAAGWRIHHRGAESRAARHNAAGPALYPAILADVPEQAAESEGAHRAVVPRRTRSADWQMVVRCTDTI